MSLLTRQREEQMLFAYWMGAKSRFPGFTDAPIIESFVKDFGHICEECGTGVLVQRLKRMKVEYYETKKGK